MYNAFVVFITLFWVAHLVHYISHRTNISLIKFLHATVYTLLYYIVLCVGWRFKKHFVYMLVPLLAASILMHIHGISSGIKIIPEEDYEHQKNMQLRTGYEYLMRVTFAFCLLICPSFGFMLIYILIFAIGVSWLSLLFGDMSSHTFVETLSIQPVYIIIIIVLFYLMQKRELKRFYQQQDVSDQGQQVLTVLNSQSDAIVVVQSDSGNLLQSDNELMKDNLFQFEFCNKQGLNLFGFYAVEDLENSERTDLSEDMINIPRFIPLNSKKKQV